TLRLLGLAGAAATALAVASPALAHDGFHRHWDHRVVVRPVVVYRPAPVYYYSAPVQVYYPPAPVYVPAYYPPAPAYYEPNPAGTIGGAIAGAAIGGIASHGRPGAIVAGSVIGAVVGSTLPR